MCSGDQMGSGGGEKVAINASPESDGHAMGRGEAEEVIATVTGNGISRVGGISCGVKVSAEGIGR